jgi:sugar phosphate permease
LPRGCLGTAIGLANACALSLLLWTPNLVSHWHSNQWQSGLYHAGFISLSLTLIGFLLLRNQPHPHSIAWSMRTLKSSCQQAFSSPTLWLCGFVTGSLLLSFTIIGMAWGSPYLQITYHLNQYHAILMTQLLLAGGIIGSILLGMISDWLQQRPAVMVIAICLALLITLSISLLPSTHTIILAWLWLLLGICIASGSLGFVLAKEMVPLRISTTTLALMNCCVLALHNISQWGTRYWLNQRSTAYLSDHFHQAFWLLPALLCLALMACYRLQEQPHLTLETTHN